MEGKEQTEGRRHPAGRPGPCTRQQLTAWGWRKRSDSDELGPRGPHVFWLVFTEKSLSASCPPKERGFQGKFPGCSGSCASGPGVVWETLVAPHQRLLQDRPIFTGPYTDFLEGLGSF